VGRAQPPVTGVEGVRIRAPPAISVSYSLFVRLCAHTGGIRRN
jgi:hypothetical protein